MSPSSSSNELARKTQSISTTETMEGFHRFVIRNYSLQVKSLATGDFVKSGTFAVAGYRWSIRFYPNGSDSRTAGHTTVYVRLVSPDVTVRMTFSVVLVNRDTGLTSRTKRLDKPQLLASTRANSKWDERGFLMMKTRKFETGFVAGDDSVTVECGVRVVLPPHTSRTTPWLDPDREINAPPPDLAAHLARLLAESQEVKTDVALDVRGERFAAHAVVLAARSPVFKAELFGPLSNDRRRVEVHDMEPAVFRVLLDFIYTDTLPADMEDGPGAEGDRTELARHLLVAADRYGMDRLKALCEGILSRSLTAQTVASTMALADRHGCPRLKEACVQFVVYLGLNNDAVPSREEDIRLNCLSFIACLCCCLGWW